MQNNPDRPWKSVGVISLLSAYQIYTFTDSRGRLSLQIKCKLPYEKYALASAFLLRIKQIIHVPRHEGEGGAVGILGMGAELGLHPLGAGLAVHPQGHGYQGNVPLHEGAGKIVATQGVGGGAAGGLDAAAGKVQKP